MKIGLCIKVLSKELLGTDLIHFIFFFYLTIWRPVLLLLTMSFLYMHTLHCLSILHDGITRSSVNVTLSFEIMKPFLQNIIRKGTAGIENTQITIQD